MKVVEKKPLIEHQNGHKPPEEDELRVLLVDDYLQVRELYTKILKKGGYTVETASSGKEALEKIKTFKPNLLILDIMMPDMHGWELARRIKEDPETKNTPVIMLSVKALKQDKMVSTWIGVESHLSKPATRHELLSAIKSVLSRN